MTSIGEAARRSGIHIETIRYYEREGIVPTPSRTAAGRRLYTESDIGMLIFVKRCRDLGFPISDIRTLQGLRDASDDQCGEVQTIALHHLQDVRDRIVDLTRLEASLASLVAECDGGRVECPALKKLFAA
jgi:MerR family mercuric resistance operon transcriptional regulator